MASGALVELVAKGTQDAYLTGEPQVSFFMQKYKRHTNFAQKPVQLDYSSSTYKTSLVSGTNISMATSTIAIKVPNKGDLLGYVWMDLNPGSISTTNTSNVASLVGNGINQPTFFELYIGGQLIDRQDAAYMALYWQKFLNDSSAKGFATNTTGTVTSAFTGTVTVPVISFNVTNTTNFTLTVNSTTSGVCTVSSGALAVTLIGGTLNTTTGIFTGTFTSVSIGFTMLSFLGATAGTITDGTISGTVNSFGNFLTVTINPTGGTLTGGTPSIFTNGIVAFFASAGTISGSSVGETVAGTNTVSVPGPIQNVLASRWLPLHFFFCDACYLPLVALQYHEVEIRVTFGADYNTLNSSPPNFYANYVVLDTYERSLVVDKEVDLLIEQVQKITAISNSKFDLSFLNHPVKCLMWGDSNVNTTSISTAFQTQQVQLYLNGTELFGSAMPDVYFSQVSSYYNSEFGNVLQGQQSQSGIQSAGGNFKMYSFALKANKHTPCGTCNFSRLDNAAMTFTQPADIPRNFYLYAVNFNILRLKGGMAGLAFSN